MPFELSNFVKTLCVSVALTSAVSLATAFVTADAAFAKNSNNNGNGNAGSNGNSGKENHGNSANKAPKSNGNSAADLGALNAAHASANALLHANPNSRVGRIAIFRDAVLETGVMQQERDDAQAALDLLPVPARPSSEVQAELDLAEIALGDADLLVADLADNDPFDQAAYDQAVQDQGDIQDNIGDLEGELLANKTYDDAAAALAELEENLLDRPAVERELLEAAANKPVTDAVELAVEEMLGLN
jgi:hypothetical protein